VRLSATRPKGGHKRQSGIGRRGGEKIRRVCISLKRRSRYKRRPKKDGKTLDSSGRMGWPKRKEGDVAGEKRKEQILSSLRKDIWAEARGRDPQACLKRGKPETREKEMVSAVGGKERPEPPKKRKLETCGGFRLWRDEEVPGALKKEDRITSEKRDRDSGNRIAIEREPVLEEKETGNSHDGPEKTISGTTGVSHAAAQ